MPLLKLNPITRKRFKRFRESRRAYWAFVILVCLYAISLVAELVCNSVPLYVRFEGHSYFPFVRFYPDDVFSGSGNFTRPDYKAVQQGESFQSSQDNFMIWPLVPYGPYEVLNPSDIVPDPDVIVHIRPEPVVGSIRLSPDLEIVRSLSAASFFGVTSEQDIRGTKLAEHYTIPEVLAKAIQDRFANRPSDRVAVFVRRKDGSGEAEFSLAAFSKRRSSPRIVKVLLREREDGPEVDRQLVFGPEGVKLQKQGSAIWKELPEDVRASVSAGAATRREEIIEPIRADLSGTPHIISFDRETVRFPFRPTRHHWLGIDDAGRDVFARIFYGLRISLTFGLVLVLCSVCIGTIVGSIQGYFGGKLDITGQRLIEIWSALPFLYIMILMGSVYGRSFMLLIFCYGLFNWIGISYYMRAEMLRLRKQPFVESARCLGLPAWKIVVRHILPNALVPLITLFPFSLVGAIGSLAALDYLGFGLPPPTPSWGQLLSQAQSYRWAWWLILYPSLSLFTVMLMGVFVGEGIRNAFDPRRYSRLQ